MAGDPRRGVPGLTDDPAAAEVLLRRTLDLARRVGGVGRVLLFSPAEAEGQLTSRSLGFRLWPADGDTPGRRYANAFRQAGELGYEGALVMGLGSPALPAPRVAEAAGLLEQHQGVLLPDGSGGVTLLGLQAAEPTLFPPSDAVPTEDEIRTRARQQLVRLHELDPWPRLTTETVGDYVATATP